MWPDCALMHATGCSHSLPGPVMECLPWGHTKKQVHFNLTEDLGGTLPLPDDLAHFLEDPTGEWTDAAHPPSPLTTSSPRQPHDSDGQCHDTPMGGA